MGENRQVVVSSRCCWHFVGTDPFHQLRASDPRLQVHYGLRLAFASCGPWANRPTHPNSLVEDSAASKSDVSYLEAVLNCMLKQPIRQRPVCFASEADLIYLFADI